MSGGDSPRLRVEVRSLDGRRAAMLRDVRLGLSRTPKSLPSKYFYDRRGSQLFEAITRQPEYYLTHAEQSLLERVADDIVGLVRPDDLVELGSGSAKKTRVLLDAARRSESWMRFVPVDVSEEALRESAAALVDEYPWLEVHGVVGDFERDLDRLPPAGRRLVAFLGSTIGNFDAGEAARFLVRLARMLSAGDHILLGVDLRKPKRVLEAAYNDAAGATAEFNKNVLLVLNRELGARFDPSLFRHRAVWNEVRSQVEMSLSAERAHVVPVPGAGLSARFGAGETIRTAVSRKFDPDEVHELLDAAGFAPVRLFLDDGGLCGLALAERLPLHRARAVPAAQAEVRPISGALSSPTR